MTGSAIFGASAWLTRIFSKHFGLQAGAELILANGFNIISNVSNVSVLYHNLKIPVLARWNWRPGNWLISPSVGAGLMLRLGEPDVLGMDTDQFEWPAAAFCLDINFIAGLKIANGYLFAGMNSSTSAGSGSVYYPGNYNLELNAVETTFKIGYELWF